MRLHEWLEGLDPEGYYCQWLPMSVHRRQWLPATPRRCAWALRMIEGTGYAGRCIAAATRGLQPAAGADAAASVMRVMASRR